MPGTVPRNYCLHGAEHLKIATGLDSCTGLTLVETLGVFKWKCVLDDGKAFFFSSDLKDGKGLRNLISTTGWIDNSVKIYKNANLILESPLTKWWDNVIQSLPANSGTPGLVLPASGNGVGIIYYFNSDQTTRAYRPAPKTAIVSLNSAKLKPLDATASENTCINFFGNQSCLLDLTNSTMSWIEVDLEYTATSAPYWAIYLKGANFSRVVNSSIAGRASTMSNSGIYSTESGFVKIKNLQVSSFAECLQWYNFNDYTHIENVFLKNCNYGLDLNALNSNSLIRKVFVVNNARGVTVNGSSSDTIIQGVSSLNNLYGNLIFGSSSTPVYIMSMMSVNSGFNNSNSDLFLGAGTSATLTNLAITNSLFALSLGNAVPAKFSGALVLGSNVNNCAAVSPGYGLVNSTCADTYTDGASTYGSSSSNAVLRIGKTAVNSFNGRVTVNDILSVVDMNGLATFASLIPAALLKLDSGFRSWGRESTNTFDNTTAQGRCSSGNCRIYDWTMKLTDTVFKNTSGDGTTQNQTFIAGATCPSAVHGNKVTNSNDTIPITYLNNAWEIVSDNVGDEDGFCESNEDCVYAPNFGAYQNELDGGELSSTSCLFQDGILSNINIYGYQ